MVGDSTIIIFIPSSVFAHVPACAINCYAWTLVNRLRIASESFLTLRSVGVTIMNVAFDLARMTFYFYIASDESYLCYSI